MAGIDLHGAVQRLDPGDEVHAERVAFFGLERQDAHGRALAGDRAGAEIEDAAAEDAGEQRVELVALLVTERRRHPDGARGLFVRLDAAGVGIPMAECDAIGGDDVFVAGHIALGVAIGRLARRVHVGKVDRGGQGGGIGGQLQLLAKRVGAGEIDRQGGTGHGDDDDDREDRQHGAAVIPEESAPGRRRCRSDHIDLHFLRVG